MTDAPRRWTHELNRYHWFVLIVAALGWLFDTMDQQLFNLARQPAMEELLAPSPGVKPAPDDVRSMGTLATSIFMIGWATGGIAFGVLGDRYGRAKTMLLTILLYSACTGLSALSVGFWDFAFYRFLTGLGVGGEFAVGVALVAEVMPDRARPHALGLLQALSAVGNVSAALIGMGLGTLEQTGSIGEVEGSAIQFSAWRIMFVIGTLPALLAILIRRRLQEPEQWKALVSAAKDGTGKKLGSYTELLGDPELRRRALVGLVLACAGVIGVWGIGFFSPELTTTVFVQQLNQTAREKGEAERDLEFVRLAAAYPQEAKPFLNKVRPEDLLDPTATSKELNTIYSALTKVSATDTTPTREAILKKAEELSPAATQEVTRSREDILAAPATLSAEAAREQLSAHISRLVDRSRQRGGTLTFWRGVTLAVQNIGAFFGIYGFSYVTHRAGRRVAFALSFLIAMASTIMVFGFFHSVYDYWMIPVMGFCQMTVFGGYAIYLPELFPTRLRSTGTSFCYNVGRYVSAVGPLFLGQLANEVFGGFAQPLRPAAITMSAVYLIGLAALPFAPETKGKPLPE